MHEWLLQGLARLGLSPDTTRTAADGIEIIVVGAIACAAYYVTNRILLRAIQRIASTTRFDWDDRLVERGVFRRLSHVVPALVIHALAPTAFASEALIAWAKRGAEIYAILAVLVSANLFLTVGQEIYQGFEIARRFPIRVYVQVVRILLTAASLIVCVSVLVGQSPLLLLSGLGAMTAVLLLVSKDSIQGLLAGIQLVSHDMVRPGDWIEMPQYGADGDVVEITLHTVKVRNWDNTIVMIPTYALISQSFKNWRGMAESGGRRIKRSIFIDISSVQFCTSEQIKRFRQIELLRQYIDGAVVEIGEYNSARHVRDSVLVNGRRLTNLGVFRQYAASYLRAHPMISKDLTLMVRQLQPTEHGLPLELYAFSADKRWIYYEGIQADIFDHLFAALPEFDLRGFQDPSGHDAVRALEPLRDRRLAGTFPAPEGAERRKAAEDPATGAASPELV